MDTVSSIRILYVEDFPDNADLLRAIVEAHSNYTMDIAATPAEAMEYVSAGEYALIILDIDLPDVNGFELLTMIREHELHRDTPVMALSARSTPEDIERGMQAGFSQYVTKPYAIESIMDSLQEVLKAERF